MKRRKPSRHYPSSGSASQSSNTGPLFDSTDHTSRVTDHGSYANGDHWCTIRKDRIDRVVCIVQSDRTPDLCKGCEFNKEEL